MYNGAKMVVIPDQTVVASIGGRVSKWFMKHMLQFLMMIDGIKERILVQNTERIEISFPDGSASSMTCLPDSEKIRGVGADCITLEEGQFMREAAWKDIYAPILQRKKVTFIVISSPKGYLVEFFLKLNSDF